MDVSWRPGAVYDGVRSSGLMRQLLHDGALTRSTPLLFLFSSQHLQQRSCPWLICLCKYGEGVRRPTLHDLVCASQEG